MLALKAQSARVAVALSVLILVPGSASAQSVYEALFGTPQAPAARNYNYAPAPYPMPFFEVEREPVRRRPPQDQDRLRFDESSLPPPPVMPAKAKPARATPDKELVASIMADPTLRKGDIVVFPDGPRVYRGGDGGSSRRTKAFEDLRVTRLVGEGTRKAVLAATRTTYTEIAVAENEKPRPQTRARPDDVTVTGAISVRASH
jgi:hypothetical protein